MPSEYSFADVLEQLYQSQLALEAAAMELTLKGKDHDATETRANVRGALQTIGEKAGNIKQCLAKLRAHSN
jgi:hypothetical protein